jgi:hypothetical protein
MDGAKARVAQQPGEESYFRGDKERQQQLAFPRRQFCGDSSVAAECFLAADWKIPEALKGDSRPVAPVITERMSGDEDLDAGEA